LRWLLEMCLGIPGQIVEITDTDNRVAKVDVSGVRRAVDVGLLWEGPDAVGPGDWVLIHVGFAISRIDEGEAQETLKALQALGTPFEEEMADLRSSAID
jgi:hydrogenase expression/formation protein HypC